MVAETKLGDEAGIAIAGSFFDNGQKLDEPISLSRPPPLPAAFNILIAGHRHLRLQESGADWGSIRASLDKILTSLHRTASGAFAQPPYVTPSEINHSRQSAIRLIVRPDDGVSNIAKTEALAKTATFEIVDLSLVTSPLGMGSVENCKVSGPHEVVSDLTARMTSTGHPLADSRPAWLLDRALEARDELALAHADIVIAVWDGNAMRGHRSGTVRILHRAMLQRKPVIWIDMQGRCCLLRRDALTAGVIASMQNLDSDPGLLSLYFEDLNLTILAREVHDVLLPFDLCGATSRDNTVVGDALTAFFLERPGSGWTEAWAGSLDALFNAAIARDFGKVRSLLMKPTRPATNDVIDWPEGIRRPTLVEQFYRWSDQRANVAAGQRRDGMWLSYIVTLATISCGAIGSLFDEDETGFFYLFPSLELGLILLNVALVWWLSRRALHSAWLSHRWLAEQMRLQRVLDPIFGVHPASSRCIWDLSEPSSETQEGADAVPRNRHDPVEPKASADTNLRVVLAEPYSWIFNRVVIAQGFAKIAQGYDVKDSETARLAVIDFIDREITGQARYHGRKTVASHALVEHFEYLCLGLFGLTILVTALHLYSRASGFAVLATVLPAIAAATTSIREQVEAGRIADQSRRIAELLHGHATALRSLSAAGAGEVWRSFWRLLEVRRLAQDAVKAMASETEGWRNLLSPRKPPLPV